jgi:hypothetical protein
MAQGVEWAFEIPIRLAKAAFSLRASSLIGGAFGGGMSNAVTRLMGGESLLDPVQTPISLTAGLMGAYVSSHVAKGAAQAGWNRWAAGFMEELIPCFLSCFGAAAAEAGAEKIETEDTVKPDDSNQTEITKELNRSHNSNRSYKTRSCRFATKC